MSCREHITPLQHSISLDAKTECADRRKGLARQSALVVGRAFVKHIVAEILCAPYGVIVTFRRDPKTPTAASRTDDDNRGQHGTPGSSTVHTEHDVGTTSLCRELSTNTGWRQGAFAGETSRSSQVYGSRTNVLSRVRRENAEGDLRRRVIVVPARRRSQRRPPTALPREPQRFQQGDLRSASGRFTPDRPCPQVGDWNRSVRVRLIEIRQFAPHFLLDLLPDLQNFGSQVRPSARKILQHRLQDQARHWIQIGCDRITVKAQCLQRDRAAAGEWIHNLGTILTVRRLHQRTGCPQEDRLRCGAPGGEVGEKTEKDAAEAVSLSLSRPQREVPRGRLRHLHEAPPNLGPEVVGAVFVGGVRQEQREQHRPSGRQWTSGPPLVQTAGMPPPHRLLGHGVLRDRGDREVHLRQAAALAGDHPAGASFQSRTVNRWSSATRSGSVPLCARIPGMIRFRTPIPRGAG